MTVISARWDLTNVYPSLESKEFQNAIKSYKGMLDKLEKFYKSKISKASAKTSSKELGALLGRSVDQFNAIAEQDAKATLKSTVDEQRPDLVLMGGYSRSLIREMVIGSTLDYTLRESTIPIFICR